MARPIRFLESPPLRLTGSPDQEGYAADGSLDWDKFEVGDMAYHHYRGVPTRDPERLAKLSLTAYYHANNASRPPLVLALPDHASPTGKLYFLVDGQCYSGKCTRCGQGVYSNKCKCPGESTPRGYYDGWTVTGTVPFITVAPSINYDDDEHGIKHYHGFVQNGVIGDG